MHRFLLWKPGWWVVHVVAILFMFWLGHFMRG